MLKKLYLKNKDPYENKKVRVESLDGSTLETFDNDLNFFTQKNTLDYCLSSISTYEKLSFRDTYINLFEPMYWRVDGPITASFSIVPFENGWEVAFQCRASNDLVGIVWDTVDSKDHKHLAYETFQNFSDIVWSFDLEFSESIPKITSEVLSPTLTVEYLDQQGLKNFAYVALRNYATQIEDNKYNIVLDWNNVKGGFDASLDFSKTQIQKIFFAAYTDQYQKATGNPLSETSSGFIRFTNSFVEGPSTQLLIKEVVLENHNVGMCTSYDDHYDLNPARIVHNLKVLGYNGFINHYCGMSHYPEMNWNPELQRFEIPDTLVTGENVVNPPTIAWHNAYARELKAANMIPVFSVSWELYSQAARQDWCQKEWDGTIGRTGYEPPSFFASLCNENALAYLDKAYIEFANTLYNNDCQVIMQIGEPWHWFNVATLNPCVYDYATRLAFHNDTGLYAPNFGTIIEAVSKTGTPYDEFKSWLRDKLGNTCKNIRTLLKNEFGEEALVCPLLFFPSIKTHTVSLATYINYPVEHYKFPNFDFLMTEAYDWVIEQPPRLDLSKTAVNQIPLLELGYPKEQVYYLSGFVPDKMIAHIYNFDYKTDYRVPVWQRIFGDVKNNKEVGINKQLLWAYPQVMFDSISIIGEDPFQGFFSDMTYHLPISDNLPYEDSIINTNSQPPSTSSGLEPLNINVSINEVGDLLVEFDVINNVEGISFSIEFFDIQSGVTLLKYTTNTFSTKIPANLTPFNKEVVKLLVRPSIGIVSGVLTLKPFTGVF